MIKRTAGQIFHQREHLCTAGASGLRLGWLFVSLLASLPLALASPQHACKTHRVVYHEDADTKIWATRICPKAFLPYHTHQTARVLIPQQNGSLKVAYQEGGEQMIHLKKNKPLFLSKLQGIKPHRDINVGKKAIDVIVVEIKGTARKNV